MLAVLGQTYECWSSGFLSIPPRSYVYSPKPFEIRNEWVESFANYVTRLMKSHLLSPDDFIGALAMNDECAATLLSNRKLDGWRNWVNGQGRRSRALLNAVSLATKRNDLNLLTCLPFESILQIHCRGSVAYCPACYEEWRLAGKPLYEPLIWAINAVTMCPRHQLPLLHSCLHCGHKVWPLTMGFCSGFCSNCQNWLGRRCTAQKKLSLAETDALADSCAISNLLKESGRLEPEQLTAVFFENARACVEICADGNVSAIVRGCAIGRRAVENLTSQTSQVPTIETALKVSRFLGVELLNLLQPGFSETLSTKKLPARTKRSTRAEIKIALERASTEIPAPSLNAVARHLGLRTPRRLTDVDAALCTAIIERFREVGKRTKGGRKKGQRICSPEVMEETLLTAAKMQNPPSLSQIAVTLGYCAKGIAVIKQMFPKLCRMIVEKCNKWRNARKEKLERALREALRESPPPSISGLSRRLGPHSTLLQRTFPELCRKLVARRRAVHDGIVARLPRLMKSVLRELPPPTLENVVKRSGVSLHLIQKLFPDEAKSIAERNLRYRRTLLLPGARS